MTFLCSVIRLLARSIPAVFDSQRRCCVSGFYLL